MNTFRIAWKNEDAASAEVSMEPGLTLAQHLYMAGAFQGRPLCSGAGRCGLCRVRFLSQPPDPLPEERAMLSPGRLDEGSRLSCRRQPVPCSLVEVSRGKADRAAPVEAQGEGPALQAPAGILGIDLGTTSVHWRCEGPQGSPQGFRDGAFPNEQLGAGSEVMSRLALAGVPLGAARLREAVVRMVRGILAEAGSIPESVCLAGNTCMIYLALGHDVSGLSRAPYRLDCPGGGSVRLDAGLPEVYIPPLLAPFVGGDVSAGLAALEFSDTPPKPPYLLSDLGTNGEFALVLPDGRVLVASVPMGPALEGVGMANGMMAGPGAAVAFVAAPAGLAPVPFAGVHKDGGEPRASVRGVCGTGYVSLAARLLSLGVVDVTGRFVSRAASPLAARVLAGLSRAEAGQPDLDLGQGLTLYATDVEALLKVKAAYSAAVAILLREAGLEFSALTQVLLAGALGEHVSVADLETLGFFPPGGASRVRAVGNTSLTGACLAAGRADVRQWLAGLPERSRLVDVVSRPDFQQIYMDSMRFAHVR
jgi:uncharacterized 2Fe-2S/4Fe-4S cluster protein (DUF4445 family)